ncbi:hypothetical protein KC336_g21608, partial [Hortaea werneckii]
YHQQQQQQYPAISGISGAPYPSFALNGSGGGLYSSSSINTAFAHQHALSGRGDYTPHTVSGSGGRSPSSASFFSESQPDPGYVTPVVPATPLSAALGPAVQATVASSENGNGVSNGQPQGQGQGQVQQDYFPQQQYTTQYRPEWGAQRAHERMDHAFNSGSAATVAGNGGYGRR